MSHLSTHEQQMRARQLHQAQLEARDEARYAQIQRERYNGTYEQSHPFPTVVPQSREPWRDGYNHNTLEQEQEDWWHNKGIWEAQKREFWAAQLPRTEARMPRYGYGFKKISIYPTFAHTCATTWCILVPLYCSDKTLLVLVPMHFDKVERAQ